MNRPLAAVGAVSLSMAAFGQELLDVGASAAGAAVPRPDHVVVVVEENRSAKEIIGSADAPYITSLARQGANFTESFGVAHPSQPNYLALFSGSTHGVTSDDCPLSLEGSNLGRQLLDAGLTFSGYAEAMPADGYTGCGAPPYTRATNPWADFEDLPASVNLRFDDFPSDFSTLPTVSFVVPDLDDDMHSGTVRQGDDWLRLHLDAYVRWAATHNSLLVLTWDEDDGPTRNRVPTVFVGPMVRPGDYSRRIDHYSVLRTIEEMYGLAPLGKARRARTIDEPWTGTGSAAAVAADAMVGRPYRLDLATGPDRRGSFRASSRLPPGLAIRGAAIEGTPRAEGTWSLDLSVRFGAAGRGERRLVITVVPDVDSAAGDDVPR